MIVVPAAWPIIPTAGQHRPTWAAVAYGYYGGTTVTELPLASNDPGELSKDAGQYPRTRLELSVPEDQLNPHTLTAPLMPWATTVRLMFGYVDQSGAPTSVLIATVRLVSTEADRPGGLLRLTCADRSSLTAAADQAADVTYAAGVTIRQAILSAAQLDGLGAVTELNQLSPALNAVVVPAGYKWHGSPWTAIEALADLLGIEVFYDAAERLTLRVPPVPAATTRFDFDTGTGGTLTGMRSKVERAPNAVALVYDRANAAGPIIGAYSDTRPGPTQVGGLYGIRRLVEERDGRPTQAQADAAAKAYATRVFGRVRTISYRTVPVPWLEPGDTIGVEPVDGGSTELHVVQAITVPLSHDPMTVDTRDPSYLGPI